MAVFRSLKTTVALDGCKRLFTHPIEACYSWYHRILYTSSVRPSATALAVACMQDLVHNYHCQQQIIRTRKCEEKDSIYGQQNRSKHDGCVLFTALAVPIYLRKGKKWDTGTSPCLPLFLGENLIFHFFWDRFAREAARTRHHLSSSTSCNISIE